MRDLRVEPPKVSDTLLRLFGSYVDWYLPRHFRSFRIAGSEFLRESTRDPILIVMNHPSWWDPLAALSLARHLAPGRRHYAPIDADALQKYRFFAKLGFFGVERDQRAGAVAFLRTGEAILRSDSGTLWVTAQGSFTDPRVRPVVLRNGIGHLLRRAVAGVRVMPVAVEYPFGPEKLPEVLIRIGRPLVVEGGESYDAREWTAVAARQLEEVQDRLAGDIIAGSLAEYTTLMQGRTGVGGVYDLWRAGRAALAGQRFHRAHSAD